MDFKFDDLITIFLVENKNLGYWFFSLYKIHSNGEKYPIQFSFHEKDFSFFENDMIDKIHCATQEDFNHLLTYQEGQTIMERKEFSN